MVATEILDRVISSNGLTIVDDDDGDRQELRDDYESQGLSVHLVEHSYGDDIAGLIAEIERSNRPVLCDLRLNVKGNYLALTGAEVVAKLYALKIPAILTTQYANSSSKRLGAFRRWIPAFVDRDDLAIVEQLRHHLSVCAEELKGNFTSERRPHRTVVRIEEVSTGPTSLPLVIAVVPLWDPHKKVELPFDSIAPLLSRIESGTRLIGEVNAGAKEADDLYFDNLQFAVAPKESIDDYR